MSTDNEKSTGKHMNTDNEKSTGKHMNTDNEKSTGKHMNTDNRKSTGENINSVNDGTAAGATDNKDIANDGTAAGATNNKDVANDGTAAGATDNKDIANDGTAAGATDNAKTVNDGTAAEAATGRSSRGTGIVVVGSTFVDIKGYSFNTFIPGGRNAGRVEQVHGGVGRNIAEDIGNVGLKPTFIGLVDDTASGAEVLSRLRRHGVSTDYMRALPEGMGTWLAIFDTTGDVVASISKRSNLLPIADILSEQGDQIFSDADSIAVEMDMDRIILKKTFALAEKHGKRVFASVSNMSIAAEQRHYLKYVDCFVCNLQEAGILFTEDFQLLQGQRLLKHLSARVNASAIKNLVVTMGGNGAMYFSRSGSSGIIPAMKVEVKDTTGAGDAFFAGVTIGLTYGKSLAEACRIGTRLAASVVASLDNVCPRFLPAEIL